MGYNTKWEDHSYLSVPRRFIEMKVEKAKAICYSIINAYLLRLN